jgi:hypothetical protein
MSSFWVLVYFMSWYGAFRLGQFTERRPGELQRYARLVWAWMNQ